MRTTMAAMMTVMIAAAGVSAPVQAVDGVTVRHLPAKVKIVDDGYPCVDFTPKVSGPNYDTYSVSVVAVTARGMRFPANYCDPKGKTRKLMMRKAGVTFEVAFTYDYRATLQGQRRYYSVYWSDGDPGLSKGYEYLNQEGQRVDDQGYPTSSDPATDYPGNRIDYGPWEPWTYTALAESSESYRTTVRLMKE